MGKKGFTLIELLAVIAILAILVIIALPNIMELFNQSKQNSFENEVKQIYKAAQQEWMKDSMIETKDIVYARCNENCSNELELSGRTNLDYYIKVDKGGNITRLFATDDTYQYEYKGIGLIVEQIGNSKQIAKLESGSILKISCDKIEKNGKDITNTQETIPTSPIIYWALQDNNEDGKNETLVLSNSVVLGNKSGNFGGNQVFYHSEDVPWIKANYLDKLTDVNLSYDVTNLVIEGEVAPVSTLNWFNAVGYNSSTFNADLSNLNVSNVIDMGYMFSEIGYNASTLLIAGLTFWDTSNVAYMPEMFKNAGYNATTWSIDNISNWNTSKVTNMGGIFYNAGYSAESFNLNLSNWDVSSLEFAWDIFRNAGYNATTWSVIGLSNWNTSKVTNMSNFFYNAGYNSSVFNLDLSGWDTSNVETMYYIFNGAGKNAATWSITGISNWNTSKVKNMNNAFDYAGYSSRVFDLDLSGWNTSNVTEMYEMFKKTGHNATTWNLTIPNTNSNGISNTTSRMFGKDSNVYIDASESKAGRTFTLAS